MFTLLPLGDIHWGNRTCDKRKFREDLKKVDEKTWIVTVGDQLDSIIVPDKRYRKDLDDSETEAIVDEQVGTLGEVLKPYATQIIGLGDGNHEDTIRTSCGTNPTKRLCQYLSTGKHEVMYLGYSWLLQLIFHQNNQQTRKLIIRGHHGWGGGSRTEGADITKFSHDVLFWQADLFLYGHVHKLKANDVEEGRIVGDHRWRTVTKKMLVCGTYQRTYSDGPEATWAEKRGFSPVTVRSPIVFMRPWQDGVELKVQH